MLGVNAIDRGAGDRRSGGTGDAPGEDGPAREPEVLPVGLLALDKELLPPVGQAAHGTDHGQIAGGCDVERQPVKIKSNLVTAPPPRNGPPDWSWM
jgi:hypothetical protein